MPQPPRIAVPGWHAVRRRREQRQVLGPRQRLHGRHDVLHQRRDMVVLDGQCQLGRLDLRQVEHIVDQRQQVAPVLDHSLKHAARPLRQCPVDAVRQQLGVAQDGIQRGTKLVAHVGKELRFVLAGQLQLQLLPSFGQLLEQLGVLHGQRRLVGEG